MTATAKTKTRKSGKRHPLLFYRRSMDRLWSITFLLGLFFAGFWAAGDFFGFYVFGWQNEVWPLVGGFFCLAFSAFAFVSRYFAYIQAQSNHMLVATPFLRMKISYRRFRSVHPGNFFQLLGNTKLSWSERTYLEPFFGSTALVVELNSFPMNPRLLRLFLPSAMFLRQTTGLVLLVKDWMALSTELDSLHGTWLYSQSRAPGAKPGRGNWG
jgi:hypothetical protein